MCGLTGLITICAPLQDIHFNEIEFLVARIKNRGPDNQKIIQCDPYAILAGTRLRITDSKNPQADIPLTSSCGRYTAALNGEIYNHQSIRQKLSFQNFKTKSDTETVLESFRHWGIDCLQYFEGMYALSIYDRQERKLYLARDPAGQKPLYYMAAKGSFIYSSDIKALISNPYHEKNIDCASLSEFISQRMILGRDTHIAEIKKLEGGTYLTLDAGGTFDIRRHYQIPVNEHAFNNPQDIIAHIKNVIDVSVKETVSKEHDAALLLSGGIDSTGLLALLQRHGLNPKTYAIGFERFSGDHFNIPTTFDEFEYSRLAASHFKTDHTELTIGPKQYLDAISSWSRIMGTPIEASEAPMLSILFDRIGDDGLRLAYGGSGPDEIFDGYGLNIALEGLEKDQVPAAYFDKFSWIFNVNLTALMPDNFSGARTRAVEKMKQHAAPYFDQISSPTQVAQTINFHGRLQAYEFNELDMTSMNKGIEVRSPLISKSFIEAAFSFNPSLKWQDGIEKWVYKQAWKDIIPDIFITRPKTGFPTPIEFWFSDIYENAINETLFDSSSFIFNSGLVDAAYLKKCWSNRSPDFRNIFYRLYCLSLMISEQIPDIKTSIQKQETIYKAAA